MACRTARSWWRNKSNAGRVVTHQHVLEPDLGVRGDGDLRPMPTVVRKLCRNLEEDAYHPAASSLRLAWASAWPGANLPLRPDGQVRRRCP